MDILRNIRTLPTGPVVAVLILGIVFGEHAQPIGVFSWIGLAIITLKSAFSWISRPGKLRLSRLAHSNDLEAPPLFSDEDEPRINPATGLFMHGIVDSAGNLYGQDLDSH